MFSKKGFGWEKKKTYITCGQGATLCLVCLLAPARPFTLAEFFLISQSQIVCWCPRLRPQASDLSLLCLTPFPIPSILHACTDCCLLVMTSLDLVQTSRNIHLFAPHFCSETRFQTIDFFFYPKPAPLTALSVSMNRHSNLPVTCVKFLGAIFDSVLYLTAGISPVSGSRQLLLGPNMATSGGSRCHL